MVLGLLIALALNSKVRGTTFARSAVFAPYVLSGVGVGLVWLFIFDPGYGVLAWLLRGIGQQSPQWINDPQLSLVMVIIVYVWKNLGYCAVVYLAGLQSLPQDVHGGRLAGRGQRIPPLPQHVPAAAVPHHVLPADHHHAQLTPGLRPDPDHDARSAAGTSTLIYEAYLQAFGAFNRAGYSAAISVVLFVDPAGHHRAAAAVRRKEGALLVSRSHRSTPTRAAPAGAHARRRSAP